MPQATKSGASSQLKRQLCGQLPKMSEEGMWRKRSMYEKVGQESCGGNICGRAEQRVELR